MMRSARPIESPLHTPAPLASVRSVQDSAAFTVLHEIVAQLAERVELLEAREQMSRLAVSTLRGRRHKTA